MTQTTPASITTRIRRLPWPELTRQLDEQGFAITDPVLSAEECDGLADLFDGDTFRSTIEMARHRFGDGRYRYFAHPLPRLVQARAWRSTNGWRRSRIVGPGCSPARTRPSR
jgi:hypothetical protein